MDNLGLEFEAIRAVIFFMYKGAVDVERCGEAAFTNAAKILCVDTNTQFKTNEPKAGQAPPKIIIQQAPASTSRSKRPTKDQMTMTDMPRIAKLTREVQTEHIITGLPPAEEQASKDSSMKKQVKIARASQTIIVTKQTKESQTASTVLQSVGLQENTSSGRVILSSPRQPPVPSSSVNIQKEKVTVDKVDVNDDDDDDEVDDVEPLDIPDTLSTPITRAGRKRKLESETPVTRQRAHAKQLVAKTLSVGKQVKSGKPSPAGKVTPIGKSGGKTPNSKLKPASSIKQEPTPDEDAPPAKRPRGRPKKNTEGTPQPDESSSNQTNNSSKKTPIKSESVESDTSTPKGVKSTKKATPTPKSNKKLIVKLERVEIAAEKTTTTTTGRRIKLKNKDDNFDWLSSTPTPRRTKIVTPKSTGTPSGELYSKTKINMWEKHENGNYQCLQCPWNRSTSKSLLGHLRIHLDERPFSCEECGRGFRSSDKLRDHMRTHTGERPFPCEQCTGAFKTNKALQRHKLIHTKVDKTLSCDHCPKMFRTGERLKAHFNNVHSTIKRFGCEIDGCNYRATDKKSVLYHEAEVHGHPVPASLITICDICGAAVRKSSIRMHSLIHAAKNLKCPECGFLTQYKNTLNGHMQRLHNMNMDGTPATKPFVCDLCGEGFFSRQQLKFHGMRHKGEKPNQCPICNFATIDKGSMNMHVRTHTGATPYPCKHCSKSFKQSSALSWHIKTVHQGLRRFRCEQCHKDYVNKKDLRAHRYSQHLKIKPFSCTMCNYCCTKKEYLVLHIEKAHGAHHVPENLKGQRQPKIQIRSYEPVELVDIKPKLVVEEDEQKEIEAVAEEFRTITHAYASDSEDMADSQEEEEHVHYVALEESTNIETETGNVHYVALEDSTNTETETGNVHYVALEDSTNTETETGNVHYVALEDSTNMETETGEESHTENIQIIQNMTTEAEQNLVTIKNEEQNENVEISVIEEPKNDISEAEILSTPEVEHQYETVHVPEPNVAQYQQVSLENISPDETAKVELITASSLGHEYEQVHIMEPTVSVENHEQQNIQIVTTQGGDPTGNYQIITEGGDSGETVQYVTTDSDQVQTIQGQNIHIITTADGQELHVMSQEGDGQPGNENAPMIIVPADALSGLGDLDGGEVKFEVQHVQMTEEEVQDWQTQS